MKPPAVMRFIKIDDGSDRHNSGGIDVSLTAVIVPLDLIDADGLGYTGHLIKVAQVTPEVGIIGDAPQVALEVPVIDRVEAHEGRE